MYDSLKVYPDVNNLPWCRMHTYIFENVNFIVDSFEVWNINSKMKKSETEE